MIEPAVLPWHTQQWQSLQGARDAGRLPHALLLAGRAGLGKGRFARRLAASLVCTGRTAEGDACGQCQSCHLAKSGSHPDLIRVEPEAEGKMIRIDAIRQLSGKSVLAAQEGGYRVIVIEPAEAMNRAAANALLKTLEEPASRTVLILVSSQADRLMATIRSRCQSVRFGVPPRAQVMQWISGMTQDADTEALYAISGGAPFTVLRAAEEQWLETDHALLDELAQLKQRRSNPLAVVEKWEQRPIRGVLDGLKRCLGDLVRVGQGLPRDELCHPGQHGDLQSLAQGIDLTRVFRYLDDIMNVERGLVSNLNEQMILEGLAAQWLEMTRPGGR
ncbi:MAG: DNA polymerase III subunit delta' [Gammaproteobacteria bacterium]|nr:DNA polymerase III subunit delta' [Gammaproteobacteria bacterium]